MIVFDASTLILIAKIELLDEFLAGISMRVAIPMEVEKECYGTKKTLDALMIQRAVDQRKIHVIAAKDKKLVAKLQIDFNLGQGEAEAIALAVTEQARIVAIDDKNGINACKLLGINFTSAIGILIRSREMNLLQQSEALARLALLGNYGRYKNSIVEDAKERLESLK